MIRLTGSVFLFLIPLITSAQDRPIVVLILADDQGYGDVDFHGNVEQDC